MDYKKIYTENYFSGNDSFFYTFGYGRFARFYFNSLFRPLKPYLLQTKRGKVLDVGCAYGLMLKRIPDNFEKYGVDISDYAISRAREIVPQATFKIGGAEDRLDFEDDSFDIIICNDVLEHLENPSTALNNIFRVLKPDGILYLNTPNLNWLRKKSFSKADAKEHHISLLPHQKLLDLLRGAGFKIEKHWTFTDLTFLFFLRFKSNIGTESAVICRK